MPALQDDAGIEQNTENFTRILLWFYGVEYLLFTFSFI